MLELIATLIAITSISAQAIEPPTRFTRHIDEAWMTVTPVFGLAWPGHKGDDDHWAGIRLSDMTPQTGP